MIPASRTPEGSSGNCQVCGREVRVELAATAGDATCPSCGSLLWFQQGPLAACFHPDGKIVDLEGTTKSQAIEKLVSALVTSGRLPEEHEGSVVAALMGREELGPTAIGHGIAVPHIKHKAVMGLTGMIGQSKSGIEYGSLDGRLVHQVFLLISPPDRPGDHLRMLEALTRTLRSLDARRS